MKLKLALTSTLLIFIISQSKAQYNLITFNNNIGHKIDLYYNSTHGVGDRYGFQIQGNELRIHSGAMGSAEGGILFGKQSNTTFTEFVRFRNDGKVGIGTYSPVWHFEVGGNGASTGIIMASGDEAFVGWYDRSLKSSSIENRWGWYAHNGSTHLWDNLNSENRITVTNTGNVGINTDPRPDCKLDVDGKIRSEEVTVELVNAPDYVFEKDYDLRTLEETKVYIEENKHLPEIPGAKEMEANGVGLADMNMKLLKKIEELTLYQIELLEKLKDQQKRTERLELTVQELKGK